MCRWILRESSSKFASRKLSFIIQVPCQQSSKTLKTLPTPDANTLYVEYVEDKTQTGEDKRRTQTKSVQISRRHNLSQVPTMSHADERSGSAYFDQDSDLYDTYRSNVSNLQPRTATSAPGAKVGRRTSLIIAEDAEEAQQRKVQENPVRDAYLYTKYPILDFEAGSPCLTAYN